MASLALSTDEILRAVALVAGLDRDPGEWDAQTQTDVRQMIRSGMREFYHPIDPASGMAHAWRFLERPFVHAAPSDDGYSTGTVTVAGGTVTLAGGTWPTWAEDGILSVDGQQVYVTDRTSDTVLAINHAGLAAAGGSPFTIFRWRVALPSDFGEFIGGVVYSRGMNRGRPLPGVVDSTIRLRYATNFGRGETRMYAVQAGGGTDAAPWFIEWWPTMDAESVIAGTYRALPADLLDDDNLLTDAAAEQIGPMHSGTLLAAILAQTEAFYNDRPGVHTQRFQSLLAASIKHDRATAGPTFADVPDGVNLRRLSLFKHVPDYGPQTT